MIGSVCSHFANGGDRPADLGECGGSWILPGRRKEQDVLRE
jgi:hypothetical protein